MTGKDRLLERDFIDGLAMLIEMAGRIDVGATMLGHQDHLAFGAQLSAADLACMSKRLKSPEGAMIGAEIRHVVVVLMAEIDNFPEILPHAPAPPCYAVELHLPRRSDRCRSPCIHGLYAENSAIRMRYNGNAT